MRKNVQIYPIPGREARKVLDMRGGQTTRRSAAADAFTAGMILGWSGAIADIPTGWALCDGSSGTPDLRGKFIVGYKSGDADYGTQGATGGYAAHGAGTNDHSPHLLNHNHPLCVQTDTATIVSGSTCTLVDMDLIKSTICFVTCAAINDPCDDIFANWCSSGGGSAEPPNHNGTRVEGDHTTTDNRPPYYVLAFIVKL